MGNSKNILLVFNDINVAELLNKHLLMPAGHEVTITSDHQEAKEILLSNPPNLLILSDKEADTRSLNLAKHFLNEKPLIPIVLFSNLSSTIKPDDYMHLGFVDVIPPPLKLERMQDAISWGLKRGENLQSSAVDNQAVQSENNKTSPILDHLECAVIAYNDLGIISAINPALREALNLPESGLIGKNIEEVILDPEWLRVMKGEVSNAGVIEVTGAGGKIFEVRFSNAPNNVKIATFFDISELKELYSLNTDFVNTVSHDLRSPLTSIFGYVDLIKNGGPLSDVQEKYLNKVDSSAHNINNLIDDILELGSVEEAKDKEKENIALHPIIQESIEGLRIQAKNRNQNLNYSFDKHLPDITGDRIQLRQMMDNLIGNAIKYTPIEGDIDITATSEREFITIKVKDTGPGISEDQYEKIFEKFYRLKNVDPTVKGTGLGLAITKSIVENHHGRIRVESEMGKGSVFTILLPAFS